jgi:ATP-dependent Clp protease ATP-binding subunit ClpA
MLEYFSARTRQVVFLARFLAGERGATAIEVDDFIQALILEDQGMAGSVFSKIYGGQGTPINPNPSHTPFFLPEAGKELLSNLKEKVQQSQAAPLSAEIPLSRSAESVLNSAKGFKTRFEHKEIEPLHVMAAIVCEGASEGVKLLQESGVTEEKVLAALGLAASS